MRGIEQIPWLYDAMFFVMDATGLGRWRDWLTKGAKGRTLEVGCGTGRNLPRYSVDTLVALEPEADAIAKARRRASNALFVRGSAQALPFREGAFETVVSSLVFCSVPEPRGALAEVRRVLKDDGELRMLEHVRGEGASGRVQDFIQPAWTTFAGGCHPNRKTEETVEECGFSINAEGRRSDGTMRRFTAKKSN